MRKFYFFVAIFLIILGLILSFENIGNSTQILIFFKMSNQSLFFPFILMMGIGIVAGFFLGLAQKTKTEKFDDADF